MTSREIVAIVAIAFVAFPLAIVALAGVDFLARPFWADEVLTWLLASDPSLPHALAALAGGVDTNAPLVHIGLHVIGNVVGHSTLAYRVVAMLVTGTSLAGLYSKLRSRCRPAPSVVGCLTFASMPIVIGHAAEARFYGLLVTASIWTAVALERRRVHPTLPNAVGLALASATLCGSHYFGILALGCLAIGEAIADRRRLIDRVYPSLAGLATLASCWPLLASQRAAARAIGGTWVPDTFWANLGHTLPDLFPVGTVVGLLSVLVLRRLHAIPSTLARSTSVEARASNVASSQLDTTAQRSAWSDVLRDASGARDASRVDPTTPTPVGSDPVDVQKHDVVCSRSDPTAQRSARSNQTRDLFPSARRPEATRTDRVKPTAVRSDPDRRSSRDSTWRTFPLLGLLLYPLALIAFDRAVQPVIVPRYLMPVLPAVAAMVAVGCAAMRARELRAVAAIFTVLFCGELFRLRLAMLDPTARSAVAIVRSVDRAGDDATIVTDWRGYAMPIYTARPALRARLRIVDDPTLADPDLARSIPYERGMTRIMQSFYGWPVTISPGELPTGRFAFVTEFPERIDASRNERIGALTFVITPTRAGSDRAATD